MGDLEGTGFIAGVATTGISILGVSYIIADNTDNFLNKTYSYVQSCI